MTAKYARQVAARKRPGMCCECGYAPREPDLARCRKCIEGKRARQRRRVAAGGCIGCGAAATPGRQRCAECAAVAAMQQAEREAKRRAAGLCVRCGKAPAARERTRCVGCLERDSRRNGPAKPRGRRPVKLVAVAPEPVDEFYVEGEEILGTPEEQRMDRLRSRWLRAS